MGLRRSALDAAALLLAAGLYAASPFLSGRLVGTGEAYNYSLSVADAVTQLRAGIAPPLAGQTNYAFNGRIHPLRDAPYLHYLAYAVDAVTGRRLEFWQLQNVSLVLSLVAAAFTCYFGLRWATACGRAVGVYLAGLYVLAPPLLCAAHTLDLFMTVHAAVFVPLAVAAALQGCRAPSFRHDLLLAAALAATWLAHPPVALWLTAATAALRLICFLRRPSVTELVNATLAVVAGAVLASFVFVSTATLSDDLGILTGNRALWDFFPGLIQRHLVEAFPACLLPVSRSAGAIGDLQLGYAGLALVPLGAWLCFRRPVPGESRAPRLPGALAVAVALGLLLLVLPVPGLTFFVWRHLPVTVYQLTTEWPVQRLYLIALAFLVFGTALLLPPLDRLRGRARGLAAAAAALAMGWTLYQAQAFVGRGFSNQLTAADTMSGYRSSNLDLTVTSYAFLGTPPTYVHGVMDPTFEYRLLRNGTDETASQTTSALSAAPVVARGVLRNPLIRPALEVVSSQNLRLLPGHRYLLTFAFPTPPLSGRLYIVGPLLNRTYVLPAAGESEGFGMQPGAGRSIPIWTDAPQPENVQVRIWVSDRTAIPANAAAVATFELRDVDPRKLPVQVDSGFPLRFQVEAPESGLTVETPRRYIPGYAVRVNGQPGRALRSPTGQVMIPVPPGRSTVELDYRGPAPARQAFWLTGAAWLFFAAVVCSGWVDRFDPCAALGRLLLRLSRQLAARWPVLLAVAALAVAGAYFRFAWQRHEGDAAAAGPVLVRFELPYAQTGLSEPLLSTGHTGAGVVVFATLVDAAHIRLGADVWGQLFQTAPIATDYSQPHTLVVSDGALLPPTNPRVARMAPQEREYFRRPLTLELDGRTVLAQDCDSYQTTPAETKVGAAAFGSLTRPRYLGPILGSERLPLPRRAVLPLSLDARLTVRLAPGASGGPEPLASILKGANTRLLALTAVAPAEARFTVSDGAGHVLKSVKLPWDRRRPHGFQLQYRRLPEPRQGVVLELGFDGSPLASLEDTAPQDDVPILISSLNATGDRAVAARFTGPELGLVTESNGLLGRSAGSATADVILTFPTDRPGRNEPLLTTGRTGAGDVLYASYVDASHIQIGFDHWNGGGMTGPTIPFDYKKAHELLITMGALLPAGAPPAAGVSVILDGQKVIDSPTTSYPSASAAVTFGRNTIGASTADPEFAGTILFVDRGGTAPPDGLVAP